MHKFNGKWYLWHRENEGYYAVGNILLDDGRKTTIKLHRYIYGDIESSIQIDHKDGDGLNNTRNNLIKATNGENSQNKNGAYSNSSTNIRGVSFNKKLGKYESYVNINYKKVGLGYYDSVDDANNIAQIARSITMPFSHKDVSEKDFFNEVNYPALYFRFGEMGGGKTEALINTAYVHSRIGRRITVLKPSIDVRSSKNIIVSRSGKSIEAVEFSKGDNLFDLINSSIMRECDSIFVDEVNFITKEQVEQLAKIVDKLGISVFGYGLRTDAFGNLFNGSMRMFEIADILQMIHKQCSLDDCDNNSIFNMRLLNGEPIFQGEQVQVGGDESYQSVCRKCYYELKEMK
jgi:thymidine kinase